MNDDIKEVSEKEALRIIMDRTPLGLFGCKEYKWYVAIDNTTGDAWTEDFKTQEECFKYLNESEPCQCFSAK